MIANAIIRSDPQLRVTASSTVGVVGAAQGKGTATDLELVVTAFPDGASAVAGSTTITVQGSDVTASTASNWTNVTPDKGSFVAVTASGQQVVHLAQLQYAYYRVWALASTGTPTADLGTVWSFQNLQDSFSNTVP